MSCLSSELSQDTAIAVHKLQRAAYRRVLEVFSTQDKRIQRILLRKTRFKVIIVLTIANSNVSILVYIILHSFVCLDASTAQDFLESRSIYEVEGCFNV